MKKHRALLTIIIVFVVLAAAAAGGWLWLRSGVQSAEQTQQEVYAQYTAMCTAVDELRLHVTEGGSPVGSFDMQSLGLRDGLLRRVSEQFSQLDRMDAEQFAALSAKEKLTWAKQPRQTPQTCEADMGTFDPAAVLAALLNAERTEPQDAYVSLEDGVYTLHEEIDGCTLDETAVRAGLQAAAASLAVTADGAVDASYDVTQTEYLSPAVTKETLTATPDSLFRDALAALEITVTFNEGAEFLPQGEQRLTSRELASIVDMQEDGTLTIDRNALAQTVSRWATDYNQYDVPFIFDSWVKGLTQIDFVTCDYLIDAQKLLEDICAQILTMQSGHLTAEATCYGKDGKPFSLGDSYIEVDFDNQQMTYIKDGRLVVNTNVVTGALNGHQTPTGLYDTHGKEQDIWLEGSDYLVFVKYWVGVVGDVIGLHDASWRSNFGASFYVYGGSHGCVNTPDEAMHLIWALAEDGTPVLLHGKNQWFEPANGNPYATENPVRGTTSGKTVEPGTRVLESGSSRIEIQPDDVVPFVLPEETAQGADADTASADEPKHVS